MMNIKMNIKSYGFVFLISILMTGVSFAGDLTIAKQHEKLKCALCHGTDKPDKKASASSCKTCHGEYPGLAQKTKDLKPNPHASHLGDLRCTVCHKTHEPSVLYCNECHKFELEIK